MLGWLFVVLFNDVLLALYAALLMMTHKGPIDSQTHPVDSTFIKESAYMFPENFLSRYPHEADPYRLKIFAYLIFNLLVKGHASVDPSRFWANYNLDDYNRVVIDAVFYEYLTDYADRGAKDIVFNPLEKARSNLSKPMSNEEISVDRIGQYLDNLSETKSQPETKDMGSMISRLNASPYSSGTKSRPERRTHSILSRLNGSPYLSERQTAECDMSTLIETIGTPGTDYPNFCDIPKTSFSCAGKQIPGIYADYETGCQAFHVCWPRRRDTFLCPIGTIFNQSLLTCDIWHDTGCFSSPFFNHDQFLIDGISTERDVPVYDGSCENLLNAPLRLHTLFLPAKCEARNASGRKVKPRNKDSVELEDLPYDLLKEILQMLRKLRKELDVEAKSRRSPRIHVLPKQLKAIPELSTETVEEAIQFTKKLGETEFEPPKVSDQMNHPGNFLSGMKPEISVTSGSHPRKSLDDYINRKQDVPDIVMRSLRLGGTILNEGVIPLAKKVMIDSYRKIESTKR